MLAAVLRSRGSDKLRSLAKWHPEGWDGTVSVAARAQDMFDRLRQVPTEVLETEQGALGITCLADSVTQAQVVAREDEVRLLLFVTPCLRRQVLVSRPGWRKSVLAEIGVSLPAVWSRFAAQTAPV